MTKPPAFLLYAADFYMDTNTWTIDEIGVYTRLLMSEWVNGPLPNEESRLARAAGCTLHRFKNSWGQVKLKFQKTDDGFLYNSRLEEVRIKQKEYEERQRVKGQKSAEKRWGEQVTTVKPQLQPTHKPKGNSSISSSSIESINTLSSESEIRTCPHSKIIEAYNRILGASLVQVRPKLWNGKRAQALQARWREDPKRQNVEWWEGLFKYIRDQCPFMTGENDKKWRTDLEWIVKASNMPKILEGKYEKPGTARGTTPGNGTGKPRILDGVPSGSSQGEEPAARPPATPGGQGLEAPVVPVAGDSRTGSGEVSKGD